ncbi:MAG: glycosyltransferase [Anaerolineales bacterium]|nr:glycosyltransferase [Anaerolineales bacterium]
MDRSEYRKSTCAIAAFIHPIDGVHCAGRKHLEQPGTPQSATVSIALCTYNGATFLPVQLESILHQTLTPSELVVGDDGSTDNTVALLEQFATTAPFPVQVTINAANLGPTQNFASTIARCNGEIIALSDQDDRWAPQKLHTLVAALTNNPSAGYAFSDLIPWTGDDNETSTATLWQQTRFDAHWFRTTSAVNQVRELLKWDRVTGAAMAFRSNLRPCLLPIPQYWFHDGWIALLSCCLDCRGIPIQEPLLQYRLHASQVTAVGRETMTERVQRSRNVRFDAYMVQSLRFAALRDRLEHYPQRLPAAEYAEILRMIGEKQQHLAARAKMHARSRPERIRPVLEEFMSGRYHHYSDTWVCIAKDLFL